jgi:acetolactate synthase-1/2/3 large subunit
VIHADFPIIGDVTHVLEEVLRIWTERGRKTNSAAVQTWWQQIEAWRAVKCLRYTNSETTIKPQYALERLEALTKDHDRYICTEVGQHQMWAAQFLGFEDPNRWMTSGGLGTMGYGVPASIGVQIAHPDALVINVAGEASWLMNMQEMGTAVQYRAAGQAVHPQQRAPRHGSPVAGASAWRALFPQLVRGPARFRETGGSLRLQGHHGERSQGPR